MKDRRLTPKQIDNLLNNPKPLFETKIEPVPVPVKEEYRFVTFSSEGKEYDTLDSDTKIKEFCSFIRELIAKFEDNQRQQEEAEAMEMDLKHCIELAPKLTEKEKKALYGKLTDVLQVRRACKSENEILQPLYSYLSDKTLLNKLAQLQGTVTNIKEIISNRQYGCRTDVLKDFRKE